MEKSVYVAGPSCFFVNAVELYEERKEECRAYGFEPRTPFDGDAGTRTSVELPKFYFHHDAQLAVTSDIIIADVSLFGGREPDSGTCVEVGMAWAAGKLVCLYAEDGWETWAERYSDYEHSSNELADGAEDFGYSRNIMLMHAMFDSWERRGHEAHIEKSFELCLKRICAAFGSGGVNLSDA